MTRATSQRGQSAAPALALKLCVALLALHAPGADRAADTDGGGCLPGERGYFQAILRGAEDASLDWRGAMLACRGGARGDGPGLRMTFSGPPERGHRLRFIVGVDTRGLGDGAAPANVTVIVEGEGRIYASQGERRCSVEGLRRERLPWPADAPPAGGKPRAEGWRVAGRGFCIDPLARVGAVGASPDHLFLDRFDFAALVTLDPETDDAHAPSP